MSIRSQRLRHSDIRRVFHLLGELTELGRDPSRWRLHMLTKLPTLVRTRAMIAAEHYISPVNPADTRLVGLVDYGWDPDDRKRFYDHLNAGGMANDPLHAVTPKLLFRSYTRRRRDMVSDEIWYASPVTHLRKECNVDDTIYTRWKLPQPGWANIITLMRAWGDTPYSPRDRWIVNLFHKELGRLWSQVETGQLGNLPPRLRQTLDLIYSGYTEKEMAQSLNLSAHTIHDFVRRLYRHFGVTTRSELLSEPICRQLLFKPALSPAYYAQDSQTADESFPRKPNERQGNRP